MAKFPSDIINNHKAMCSVCGLLNQHTVKIKYPKNAETARIAGNCKYKKKYYYM